jgi:hypothetical protein
MSETINMLAENVLYLVIYYNYVIEQQILQKKNIELLSPLTSLFQNPISQQNLEHPSLHETIQDCIL